MKAKIENGVLKLKAQNFEENETIISWNFERRNTSIFLFIEKPDFTKRNQEIVRLRSKEKKTFREIDERFGISQTRTRKIYLRDVQTK